MNIRIFSWPPSRHFSARSGLISNTLSGVLKILFPLPSKWGGISNSSFSVPVMILLAVGLFQPWLLCIAVEENLLGRCLMLLQTSLLWYWLSSLNWWPWNFSACPRGLPPSLTTCLCLALAQPQNPLFSNHILFPALLIPVSDTLDPLDLSVGEENKGNK